MLIQRFEHGPQPYRVDHRHDTAQVFVLTQGLCRFGTEAGDWLMVPGAPGWVPPGIAHHTETHGPVAGLSLSLTATEVLGLPDRARVAAGSPFISALIERLAAPLPAERCARLLAVLAEEMSESPEIPFFLPQPANEALRRITATVGENPADGRGLDDWAKRLGIPPRTLIRHFRQETGLSFSAWRQRARLTRALTLLHAGVAVEAVATAVGYESGSAFVTSFRAVLGQSPRQYAKAQGLL